MGTDRQQFLEQRRKGIGGSDIAAICGWDPFRDAHDVYLEKTRPPEEAEEGNIHILRGNVLEDVAVELYEEQTGREGRRQPQRHHPEHEWALANVDYQVYADEDRPEPFAGTGVLEVKAPSSRSFQRIVEAGLYDSYIAQLVWYMGVLGYDWGSYALINLEHDAGPLLTFDREHNPDLFQAMLDRAGEFWHLHVEERDPPEPDQFELAEETTIEDTDPTVVETRDPQLRMVAETLLQVRGERKDLEDRESELKQHLQTALEDREADRVKIPGLGKFYYDKRSRSGRLDEDKLERVGPLDPDAVYRHLREESMLVNPELDDDPEFRDELIEKLVARCQLDLEQLRKPGSEWKQLSIYPE